jgi:hypothetical protein
VRIIAAVAALVFAAPTARADDRFGTKGQVVPLGSLSLSYSSLSVTGASGSLTSIALGPTLIYFVAQDLALGASGTLIYQNASQGNTSASATAFGLEPFVAYNLWLSETASLVPELGIGFASRDLAATSGSNPTLTTISLQFFVPILFHPVRHFFLGFGPAFSYDLAASVSNATGEAPKTTTIGAQTILGGYF